MCEVYIMSWNDIVEKTENNQSVDWTQFISDNYLIYADSKVGKTFVAVAKIKELLDTNEKTVAYILNTDMGFAEPALKYKLNDEKYKGRIVYHQLIDLKKAVTTITDISKKITKDDIILFDLYGWAWEEAQNEFIMELGGPNPIGFIARASEDPAKFGVFTGIQWNYVKKVEDLITAKLTKNPICKIIALTTVKDVSMDYAIGKKKKDIWCELGKPGGKKNAMYDFATTIKLEKEETPSGHKRKFMIVATRQEDTKRVWTYYTTGEDFWAKVKNLLKQ